MAKCKSSFKYHLCLCLCLSLCLCLGMEKRLESISPTSACLHDSPLLVSIYFLRATQNALILSGRLAVEKLKRMRKPAVCWKAYHQRIGLVGVRDIQGKDLIPTTLLLLLLLLLLQQPKMQSCLQTWCDTSHPCAGRSPGQPKSFSIKLSVKHTYACNIYACNTYACNYCGCQRQGK